MVELLSPEWLDRQREATSSLPEWPGASARIAHRVKGGPDGVITAVMVLENGRISENTIETSGDADDTADFTIHCTRQDVRAFTDGTSSPDVAFMQGRVKITGDLGRMLSVLPVTTTDAWRTAMAAVAAETDPD